MGTKIIEIGSTAGGIAKVEYKDEAGNVLWYYDDAGNFVRNGNAKITGLAGTDTRMVTADASGNLSANGINTYTPTLVFQVGQVGSFTQYGTGSYTITGNMVKVIFSVDVTALPSAGSFLSIILPINRKARSVLSGYFSRYNGINVSTTADFIGLCDYGLDSSAAWFIKSKNDGTGGLNGINISELSSGIHIQGVIEYEID